MGNTTTKYEPSIEEIKRFANEGNKYAQFDLGMYLIRNNIDDEIDPARIEWFEIDLVENLLHKNFTQNPGIYWLCQAVKKRVPKAVHVLAYITYNHYKFYEKTNKPDPDHDFFLKASLKLCSIAIELDDDIFDPYLERYSINIETLNNLTSKIRNDIFDRIVLTGMSFSDFSKETIDTISTKCCNILCKCKFLI